MRSSSTPDRPSRKHAAAVALRPPKWPRTLYFLSWPICAALIALAISGAIAADGAIIAACAAAPLLLTALGALSMSSGVFARPLTGIDAHVAGERIAITFDDGPDPEVTPQVLDLLDAGGHRATFFVIGERARRYPELIAQIAQRGHELANHSSGHQWHLCFWRPKSIASDLESVSDAIAEAGVEAAPFFRPPNAVLSPRFEPALRALGYQLIGFAGRGYDRAPGASAAASFSRLRRALRPGAILLLHDRPGPVLEALSLLLDELERRQLVSVAVGELIRGGEDGEDPRRARD